MEKTKKDKSAKRPLGRQPFGSILVDGKWEPTELTMQIQAQRVLRLRQARRTAWRKSQDRLRAAYPELFVLNGLHPSQTTLTSSTTENVDRPQYQKTDTTTYDAFWRSVQRDEDGASNLSSESTSL